LDENLISFNAPSRTLDSTWGEPKAPARHINARTNTTRLATPTATSTANSTDAPKKVGYVPPHLRVLVSEPQYSLGYISPPLRHLPPSPQPKTKSENGTKGQVASAGRSSSGTFTSFAPPAQNQGQPGPPSGMQQQSPWSGAVNSSQGPPTPRVAATQSTINQRKNAPIGQNSGFKYNNPKAFPALQTQKTVVKSVQNIIDTPKMELRKENVAWCVKNDLFPEAPPAVAPLAGLMESMTLSPPEEENPDNPDNPKFNVAHYFVSLTRKYKCPYKGCK
jgi:hypothetical protein